MEFDCQAFYEGLLGESSQILGQILGKFWPAWSMLGLLGPLLGSTTNRTLNQNSSFFAVVGMYFKCIFLQCGANDI